MKEWMSGRMAIIAFFEMPRCSRETRAEWSWFLREKEPEVSSTEGAPGRRGTASDARQPKGADDDDPLRNNRADIHGSPTVNGDHFKRSRPQCVYLANVKFTRGKGGIRIDATRRRGHTRRHLAVLFLCRPKDTNPIVLCDEGSLRSRRAWLV